MMPLAIELYSDVVCPWCYIGATRLRQAIQATPGLTATVSYRPFLLEPDLPHEGADLRARLRKKYGVDPQAIFTRVEREAHRSGIPLDFTKVQRSYSTVPAHTILRHARSRGSQAELAEALFAAYFLDGKNISDAEVLTELATPFGFDAEEAMALAIDPMEQARTRAEADSARMQGINGVPFTVLGGRLALSGAQPLEVFKSAIARAVEEGASPRV